MQQAVTCVAAPALLHRCDSPCNAAARCLRHRLSALLLPLRLPLLLPLLLPLVLQVVLEVLVWGTTDEYSSGGLYTQQPGGQPCLITAQRPC